MIFFGLVWLVVNTGIESGRVVMGVILTLGVVFLTFAILGKKP